MLRAFFRAHAADLLGDLEKGKSNQSGFRWDKSIKAFCLLCVHYVIHAKGAEYDFSDDSRKNNSGPDAAETLTEVLNRRGGWPAQLFKSKSPDIRKQIFRSTNQDGVPEKPLTRIIITKNLLSPSDVKIYSGSDALSMVTDEAILWGLLTALKKESPDFRSMRGTLPERVRKIKNAEYQTDVKNSEAQESEAERAIPIAAASNEPDTNTAISENTLVHYIKTLPIPSIITHIISILESVENTAELENFQTLWKSPVLVHAMAEKLSSVSIDDFFLFYRDTIVPLEPFKIRVAKDFAVNQVLRKKLAATVARAGFRDMLAWFNVFSKCCDHAIILDLEQELITVAKEPDFKDKFLIFAPDRLPSLIEHFSRFGCVVAVQIFEKINEEVKANEDNENRILYGKRNADKE